MRGRLLISLLVICGCGVAKPARAAFMNGDPVRIEWLYPDTGTLLDSWDVIVGPGVEVPDAHSFGAIDINLTSAQPSIIFDFTVLHGTFGSASFNGFRFSDYTGTLASFSGLTIDPITNMTGLDSSRLTFSPDEIFVNFQSLSADSDTVVGFDVSSVPEPGTLLLLGGGLVGLAARRRRAS
jgi:hypothetical protein